MASPFYPAKSLRLSDSTIGLFRSCARKFEFRKLFLHPARDESLPAEVGKSLHEGFQDYLVHGDEESAIVEMMLRYPVRINTTDNDKRSLWATYATLMAMLQSANLSMYELVYLEIDGKSRPAIEVPFEFVLSGIFLDEECTIPITYVGKIDAIYHNRLTDTYIVVDVKTTGRNYSDMTATYRHDEQAVPYGMILERLLGREIQAFDVIYLSTFVDLDKPQVTEYQFTKLPSDIQDWARGLMIDIQLIRTYYAIGWFRRDSGACQAYGKPCIYFDYCQTRDHELIQRLLAEGEEMGNLKPIEDTFGKPWVSMPLVLEM